MKIEQVYDIIEREGFTAQTLQTIDNYIKEIQNGTEDFPRFNLSEHAGLCTAGAPLIGRTLHGRCASHWGVHHRELRDSKHYSKLQC